ncbi:hypothetical protein NXV73_09745 [Bacteroides salyersiae]|nr:hypothetical protein [Bacteroides salyersiae]
MEYMIWPRALAISETLWTDARLRNRKFFVNEGGATVRTFRPIRRQLCPQHLRSYHLSPLG